MKIPSMKFPSMKWMKDVQEPEAMASEELPDLDEAAMSTDAEEGNGDPGRIQALEAEAAEWKDRALRTAAEMENFRRRSRLDLEDSRKFGNERLLTDLLPVLDNFTRALDAARQTEDFQALQSGVELIHRQMTDFVARAGLEKIEALGQPFDPNQHEAIMQVPAEEGQEPNTVVEELRAGYRLHERVVRPSLVKVTAA